MLLSGCASFCTADAIVWDANAQGQFITSLCQDTHACTRIGTEDLGVSVFNGKDWKIYGPVDGPLGSRVFALAVSPQDGGVWGATEAGLFRCVNSHWTYFTRADGLPSDQANALAFPPDGTLYVGTQLSSA